MDVSSGYFYNYLSEFSKWYTVEKLVKLRIFFIWSFFLIRYGYFFILKKHGQRNVMANVFYKYFLNRKSERCKWYAVGKLLKFHNFFSFTGFFNSSPIKFNFENILICDVVWKYSIKLHSTRVWTSPYALVYRRMDFSWFVFNKIERNFESFVGI